MRLVRFAAWATLLGGAAGLTVAPQRARACGGFFCSQVPVVQSGEQIIFGMHGDTITAQILINYAGDAEDFAWILPVASTPEISLGTLAAFQQLGFRTEPTFRVEWSEEALQCNIWYWGDDYALADADGEPAENTGGGVQVVSQKDVGPFETVVLQSSSTADLVKWLDENDYDQPSESLPLIDHYVRQDMQFVALRLKKDEPTGAIQPITLTFREADPCVPLVLTRIAAAPNMPVQLYLFADHRVVPTNWFHVVVNERRIDWLRNGQNYKDLLSQAVDEAAGHGFATEYAGPADITKGILYAEGRFDLAALERTSDPAAFVDMLLSQGFPRDGIMQQLIRQFIPMPESVSARGVSERDFYNNLEAYAYELAGQPFDSAGFVDALRERIVTPLVDTQALFDAHPKLTRLYTTVSEDDMNRDPIFAENPDLPDVSNEHVARGDATCGANPRDLADVTITLPDRTVIVYRTTEEWPYFEMPPELADEPAAGKIELIGRTGAPVLVDPNKAQGIDQVLHTLAPESVLAEVAKDPFEPPIRPPRIPSVPTEASGCTTGTAFAGLAALWALVVALGARRRF